MKINSAEFLLSNTDITKCPPATLPEYAFIGRSNVGKSSLINMLTGRKQLAKTSGTPGKTQLINHFKINNNWLLVDLPGYGYAKVSKQSRNKWQEFITEYLTTRENLMCVFLLIDSRIPPQKIDLEFMEWMGVNGIPFVIVYTKIDKLSSTELNKKLSHYKEELLKTWESIPDSFSSSAVSKFGQDQILSFIDQTNPLFENSIKNSSK